MSREDGLTSAGQGGVSLQPGAEARNPMSRVVLSESDGEHDKSVFLSSGSTLDTGVSSSSAAASSSARTNQYSSRSQHVSQGSGNGGSGQVGQDNDDAALSVLLVPALAEFIGTMVFVLVGILSVMVQTQGLMNPAHLDYSNDFLIAPLAHGMAIFILITITVNASGGHLNPAVTMGLFLNGQLGLLRLLVYWAAQVAGATIGAALALGFLGKKSMMIITYGVHHPAERFGPNGTITPLVSDGKALGLEMFATFVVVIVVLQLGSDQLGPLYVGLAVVADIITIGPLTGGSMNPARSFGPVLVSLDALGDSQFDGHEGLYFERVWKPQWIYWVGPMLGALLASIVSRYGLAEQQESRNRRLYLRIKLQ
eukprot:scpid54281/ scgid10208/ Aquaporin TIP2-2; Tonoplast intrinsic protein 2-2; ZmTIP2-2; ZmTIP2